MTGENEPSTRLQEALNIWRKEKSNRVVSFYYPYNDPDIHFVAEKLVVHIYEYRSDTNPPSGTTLRGISGGVGVPRSKNPFTYTTVLGWEKGDTTRGIPSSLSGER